MKTWKQAALCLALAIVALAAVARDAAADVVLTGRSSQIQISGSANEGGPLGSGGEAYYPPATGSTDFYASFTDSQNDSAISGATGSYSASSSADQISSLDTGFDNILSVASGYGMAHATAWNVPAPPQAGGGSALGDSFFDIFFDVTLDSVPYTLTGSVNGAESSTTQYAEVMLSKTGVGGYDIFSDYVILTGSTFDSTGVLTPGSYRLHMQAHADAPGGFTGESSANFNATLTVPEPSSFILLGIGAISLLGYARRRRAT